MVRHVAVEHVKQSTMPKISSKSSKDGSKPGTVHILKFEVVVDGSQCLDAHSTTMPWSQVLNRSSRTDLLEYDMNQHFHEY